MADGKKQASTTSSQETAPASCATEPVMSHGGTNLNPPCKQNEPPEVGRAHSPPQDRDRRARSESPEKPRRQRRRRSRSYMRSRSPLRRDETLLARAIAQPEPDDADLTEGLGPDELRKAAAFLTRQAHKHTAAAKNHQTAAMQCHQTAHELGRRAEREAGEEAPEAAAAAEAKLRPHKKAQAPRSSHLWRRNLKRLEV